MTHLANERACCLSIFEINLFVQRCAVGHPLDHRNEREQEDTEHEVNAGRRDQVNSKDNEEVVNDSDDSYELSQVPVQVSVRR